VVYKTGDYTVVPANQLLVRTVPLTSTYGAATSYAIASASYYDPIAQVVVTLPDTQVGPANQVTVNDGAGGRASFTVTPRNSSLSSAQLLPVGVYDLGVSGAATTNGQNFSNTITLIGSQTVNPKALMAVPSGGVSKIYDGGTSMNNVSLLLTAVGGGQGVMNGDVVNALGSGEYAGRNVGTQLGYVLNDLSLGGPDAANYYLASGRVFAGNNGSITPRPLTLTYTGVNKTYDGTQAASVTRSDDRISGDVLTLTQSAAFTDKNVGTGKAVNVSAITLSGADAGNYNLASTTASTSADITKANAVVTANSDTSKVYNGQVQTVSGFSATGLVNGESAAVFTGVSAGGSGTNAGTYTSRAIGTDGNYNLSFVNGQLTIGKAPLSVTANNAVKTQDGVAYQGGNGVQYAGWVAGETSAVLNGRLVYGGASQGAVLPGDFPLVPSGLDALNYQVRFVPGTLTINAPALATPGPWPVALPKTDGVTDLRGGSEIRPASVEMGQLPRDAGDPCGPDRFMNGPTLTPDASGIVFKWLEQPSDQRPAGLWVQLPPTVAAAPAGFSIPLPTALWACANEGAGLRVTGEQGQDLPTWLTWDSAGQRLVAQPVPAGGLPVRVWAQMGRQRLILEITSVAP
jgi:hypothetical protein